MTKNGADVLSVGLTNVPGGGHGEKFRGGIFMSMLLFIRVLLHEYNSAMDILRFQR